MLSENLCIWLEVVKTPNPTTLLPVDSGPPEHDYLENMDELLSSQPDLTDQPINHLDVECFTEGSSLVWDGTHFARHAVETMDGVTDAHLPPVGTSA
jgi:hypothetical protein